MKYRITINDKMSKIGNAYHTLSMEFENGYKFETFLNNEQYFIISQLLEK